jgi:predicted DNA-binding protein (MmcQ/YjbR family)
MNVDEFNRFCAGLAHTTHVVQWGGSEVWKVGGKVFAIAGWNEDGDTLGVTFKVSEMAFISLPSVPGLRPAPYFASRGMKWIQQHAKPGFDDATLCHHIEESYRLVSLGLTKRLQKELGLNQGKLGD